MTLPQPAAPPGRVRCLGWVCPASLLTKPCPGNYCPQGSLFLSARHLLLRKGALLSHRDLCVNLWGHQMLSKHLLLLPEGHTLHLRSSHSPSPPTRYTRHLLALLKSFTLALPRGLGACRTSEEQP